VHGETSQEGGLLRHLSSGSPSFRLRRVEEVRMSRDDPALVGTLAIRSSFAVAWVWTNTETICPLIPKVP
jgi:hypothetical protein